MSFMVSLVTVGAVVGCFRAGLDHQGITSVPGGVWVS